MRPASRSARRLLPTPIGPSMAMYRNATSRRSIFLLEACVRIDRLELRLCKLPLVSFFETSFGRSYDREFLLVRLEGDGHEGWGEAVAEANPYYSSETTETAWHIITGFLASRLLGHRFDHPRDVFDALRPVRGH